MTLPREPFSWDGAEDLPVPLDAPTPDEPECAASPQILSEAETLVREAQEAIGRQVTDPTISIPAPAVACGDVGEESERSLSMTRAVRSLSRRSLAIALTVGCAFAFLHGWSVGATAAEHSHASSCDTHHCPVDQNE